MQQTPRPAAAGVAGATLRLGRLVEARFDAALRARTPETRPSHARALFLLDAEGTRLSALAGRLGVTKQAAGQLADELAERGLVTRELDPTDARARRLRLTPRGRRALAEAQATLAELDAALAATLGPELGADLEAGLTRALEWANAGAP